MSIYSCQDGWSVMCDGLLRCMASSSHKSHSILTVMCSVGVVPLPWLHLFYNLENTSAEFLVVHAFYCSFFFFANSSCYCVFVNMDYVFSLVFQNVRQRTTLADFVCKMLMFANAVLANFFLPDLLILETVFKCFLCLLVLKPIFYAYWLHLYRWKFAFHFYLLI